MVSVRKGPLLVRTIRATQLARLYQLRCIDNANKLVDTRHPRDRISRPQRPLHLGHPGNSPLRAKARRWKASGPEPARRAHSGAEKLSIVLSTVTGTPRRVKAARRGTHHPNLLHARRAIN